MSKYTEAAKLMIEEHRQDRCWTEESFEAAQKIEEACRIADRLKDVDVKEATDDYCNNANCNGVCDECRILVDFRNGYNQALIDIRGDKSE